jgi:hypothetical protein
MFYILFRSADSLGVNNHLFVRLVFPPSSPGFDFDCSCYSAVINATSDVITYIRKLLLSQTRILLSFCQLEEKEV